MCGIALIIGDRAPSGLFETMLSNISTRGEVTERRCVPGLLAGTRRLPIVDRQAAVQPWTSSDGRWLLCFNGEVYNHTALRAELRALGHAFRTESDTEVVLEAYLEWGESAVERLRGDFAFAVVDTTTRETYVARDPLGVKPLHYSLRDGTLHLASEVKALVPVGAKILTVGPGHHGRFSPSGDLDLRRYFDPLSDLRRLGPLTDHAEAVSQVRAALTEAIEIRLDTDLPVGIVLSGGLDSSLVLTQAAAIRPDCVAFTIGSPDSPDLAYARRLTSELGVRHEVIDIDTRKIGMAEVREAIRIGELDEYGDIINAVVSVPLFRRIQEAGIKVVLSGDGSDELFGGYPMYHNTFGEQGERLVEYKLRNLGRTELQRVDRTSMAHGVEVRVPFLDQEVVRLAARIPLPVKTAGSQEKWLVREAFADTLPDFVRLRPKSGMSYSSGLHDRARLFKPAFPKIHRSYGYDLHSPIRRDFDALLRHVDNNLDSAFDESQSSRDHTLFEKGRDLLGAVRWNAQPTLDRLRGRQRTAPAVDTDLVRGSGVGS